jgi:hypothetical protein
MPYTPTNWKNAPDTSTPMSATNLNKLTDELESQAAVFAIPHTLPTWANGVAPAITDPNPLNEMERVTAAVAQQLGLSYGQTVWESGWNPARNATRLNKLETAAMLARSAIENLSTGNKLTWAPPGFPNYVGYQQRTISNSALTHTVTPGTNVDAKFTISGPVTAGAVTIDGFRNVVIIGGEINRTSTSPGNVLRLFRIDGIVHLEGVWIHGAATTDCIGLSMGRRPSTGLPGGTFRAQNVRLESTYDDASLHADNVQIWSEVVGQTDYVGGCGPVLIDRMTCYTRRQALFWGNHDGALGNLTIKNCQMHNITGFPAGHILFKTYRTDIFGRSSHMTLGENVYVHSNHSADLADKLDWVVPDELGGYDNGTFTDSTRQVSIQSDAQGEYFTWEATADVSGIARLTRPAQEIVPASLVAQGAYVSPGYV